MTPSTPHLANATIAPDAAAAAADPEPLHAFEQAEYFRQLKAAVLAKRPVLGEILERHGREPLHHYALNFSRPALTPPRPERQVELITIIEDETTKRLGPAVGASVARQLRQHYSVSTADHHGPMVHPFFLSSNLLAAVPLVEAPDPDHENVIVLACANVSLENSSFPRGVVMTSLASGRPVMQRLPFFSTHIRPSLICRLKGYTRDDLRKARSQLQSKQDTGSLTKDEVRWVGRLLEELYDQPDVLSAETYSDQVTKTNFRLWQRYFPEDVAAPNLVYLELETIVTRLLLEHHLRQNTTIHRMLFDPRTQGAMEHFEGILGAFSRDEQLGTYLFWGVPEGAKHRLRLWRDGNRLVSTDGRYSIALTPDALETALNAKELVPSILLDFTLLACYYGLQCNGGFSQVNYLTLMKEAYCRLAAEIGDDASLTAAVAVETKVLCGDITVAFLTGSDDSLVPATGLDLLRFGQADAWARFVENTKTVTLEAALNPMFPDFYKIIYPEAERDPKLAALNAEDVTRLTELDRLLKPCATIPYA